MVNEDRDPNVSVCRKVCLSTDDLAMKIFEKLWERKKEESTWPLTLRNYKI